MAELLYWIVGVYLIKRSQGADCLGLQVPILFITAATDFPRALSRHVAVKLQAPTSALTLNSHKKLFSPEL